MTDDQKAFLIVSLGITFIAFFGSRILFGEVNPVNDKIKTVRTSLYEKRLEKYMKA